MSNKTYCNMPMITCPHCGKEFQYDDYYDTSTGDEITCQHCEKEIHVACVDHIMAVTLSTEKDDQSF